MARGDSRISPKWPTTHPSMVDAAKGPDGAKKKKAWEDFCRDRWEPLLSYARKFNIRKEDAEDIVQELLADGLAILAAYDPSKCKLRHFLMTCVKNRILNKLRDEKARPDHKGKRVWFEDDTKRVERGLEDHRGTDPDEEFDPEWRDKLFDVSMKAMEDWLSKEHPADIRILKEWVLTEPNDRPDPKEFARSLGMSVPAMQMCASRRRKDLLEEIERQVRREFPADADVRDEVRRVVMRHFRRKKGEQDGKPSKG